jgi:FMN phosphatase YigB (HAD superfamily)
MNTNAFPILDLTPETKNGNKNMLILDFDGVLINSLDEVTLTVYNTTTGKQVTSLDDLPAALVKLFQRNRYHVQPIGDAILLMGWCLDHYRESPVQNLAPREYEALISNTDVPVTVRTNRIYETRSHFITRDLECWLALHQPYQPLWGELMQRPKFPYVILTNKNHDATLRLCRRFGLSVQAADVYSGDHGLSKVENMRQIQERFGDQNYRLVDDSVKNLQELADALRFKKKKIRMLFASWGYTGPGDEKKARDQGFAIINQKDLIARVDKEALSAKNG